MKLEDRYTKLMTTALQIQQLQLQLDRKLRDMANHITAAEISTRRFNDKAARLAFSKLPHISIKPSRHVQATLTFRDIEVYLHSEPHKLGSVAMAKVLEKVSTKDITQSNL